MRFGELQAEFRFSRSWVSVKEDGNAFVLGVKGFVDFGADMGLKHALYGLELQLCGLIEQQFDGRNFLRRAMWNCDLFGLEKTLKYVGTQLWQKRLDPFFGHCNFDIIVHEVFSHDFKISHLNWMPIFIQNLCFFKGFHFPMRSL